MYETLVSPEQKGSPAIAEVPVEPAPVEGEPVVSSGEANGETYASDYVAMLLVNSFRFSQGMVGTQKTILFYLAEKFGENFDPDAIKEAIPIAGKTIHAIVNNPAVHPRTRRASGRDIPILVNEGKAKDEAEKYADELISSLKNHGSCPVETIVDGIVARDFRRLGMRDNPSEPSGRIRKGTHGKSPFTDPNFSQWVYFGLMGQTTGMPEYDQMFADMVKVFERLGADKYGRKISSNTRDESAALIKFYLEHHPEQIGLLPDACKPKIKEEATV